MDSLANGTELRFRQLQRSAVNAADQASPPHPADMVRIQIWHLQQAYKSKSREVPGCLSGCGLPKSSDEPWTRDGGALVSESTSSPDSIDSEALSTNLSSSAVIQFANGVAGFCSVSAVCGRDPSSVVMSSSGWLQNKEFKRCQIHKWQNKQFSLTLRL